MEYIEGGDLFEEIKNGKEEKLPEEKSRYYFQQIITALEYCHNKNIIHRDLKPENILMTDLSMQADIRLLDFGLSKIVGNDEKCTEPYGTLSFVAPEVLQGKPYDKSVDLWSIGIIAFLLLCGYLPFDDKHSEREIARQTIQDPVPFEEKIWSKYSPEAKSFVDGLLQKKPEKRYTIKEVLEHPWIKKMDKVPEKRKENKNKSQFGTYTSKEE
jgi:serine/threonine protein kinase